MIKEEVQLDQVAVHEFDVEHGMLSRISHPNIIQVSPPHSFSPRLVCPTPGLSNSQIPLPSPLSSPSQLKGAGRLPRRFIVLEYLGGGSLSSILTQNQAKPGIAQKLFRRPSFTYHNLLSRAKDMADALEFLNSTCHPGATIIHRGKVPSFAWACGACSHVITTKFLLHLYHPHPFLNPRPQAGQRGLHGRGLPQALRLRPVHVRAQALSPQRGLRNDGQHGQPALHGAGGGPAQALQ